MEGLKKHVDTIVILTGVLASVLWMNASMNNLKEDLHKEISTLRTDVQKDINLLRNDITIIKTVLIMKDIMPVQLASKEE
jgi:hypothetical protein